MPKRDEIEKYLQSYPKTHSTEMDNIFGMFKSDVYSLAKDVQHNEAYLYSRDEWLNFIDEQADKTLKDELLKDLPMNDFDVVIDKVGSGTYYI